MPSCSSVPALEVPPGVSESGSFVVIVDGNGQSRMLMRPSASQRSTLIFDGDQIYFVDGSDDYPWFMNGIPTVGVTGSFDNLLVRNGAGRIFSLVNETLDEKVLLSRSGTIYWGAKGTDLDGILAPLTGSGILGRDFGADGATWLNDPGIAMVDADQNGIILPNGTNGQFLMMAAGIPTWGSLPSGNIASGVNSVGLEGVNGKNTSSAIVSFQAPTFTLSNGTDDLKVANVNISADLTNAVGLGGLDTGTEAVSTWYYFYIISDGAAFAGIISTNPAIPDFGATGYTYYALMSVFRNDAAGNIVDFLQRGRTIHIAPQLMSNDVAIGTAFAAVPQTTALTTIVPPNVKSVSGVVGGASDASSSVRIFMASTATKIGMQAIGSLLTTSTMESFKQDVGSFHDIAIVDPSAPALFWRADAANAKRRIVFTKYKI